VFCFSQAILREVPPSQALATFQLAEGFQIELVASEPLVADPVAMEIDENGRMYVVEMHGYPLDKSGTGKIKILTDADGDGKMDHSTVFAEGLMLPTGIMRWKQGVLVTDAPHVLYLADTDQDGRADVRDTLLTGFALSNPQHNLNGPVLGLDNWVYLAHESAISTQSYQTEFGDRGGEVYYPDRSDSPRLPENAQGRSVRMKPDQGGLEILASNTQFGHTFDPWGHYMVVSNANHAMHQVIGAEYLQRNPHLLVSNATQSISDHGRAAEVFPITQNPQNQLLTDVGVITSACGSTYYQGGLFPARFDSVVFVAEPVSNLIHADVLQNQGATFTASRVYPDREFLASTDAWFRPVNMYTGPDGALYVVDYYRQIIEHPEWMADEVVRSGALYNGTDMGRIYRITPRGTPPATWTRGLPLGQKSSKELVQTLAEPNLWWRRHAQRLLLDRRATEIVPDLEAMARRGTSPLGRLHALWTLEGLGALTPQLVVAALRDTHPGVRENALKLSERFLAKELTISKAILGLVNDPDAKVRYQLLCTLGYLSSPAAIEARHTLLFRDMEDPWVQIAALSAVPSPGDNLLDKVLAQPASNGRNELVERLSTLLGSAGPVSRQRALWTRALDTNTTGDWPGRVLRGLALGLKNNRPALAEFTETDRELLAQSALSHPSLDLRKGAVQLLQLTGLPASTREATLNKAAALARSVEVRPEQRATAVQVLALHKDPQRAALYEALLIPTESLVVQLAAMQALAALPGSTVSRYVIERWASLTPELRNAAISTFLGNDARVTLLLDAVEQGTIDPASIGWPRSVSLMAQKNIPLRDRARRLLTQGTKNREELAQQYQSALSLTGNQIRGQAVYKASCSACHQIGGAGGTAYGPDLGTIRNRRPESILGDILNPNLSIADGYDIWTLEMNSGETHEGLIVNETPTSLTLRRYGGDEAVIARTAIKSLKALGVSVMPAGLEKQINPQQMADLLAFLKKGQ
jgi:putative membrane-bound dehydrogenase-like protein